MSLTKYSILLRSLVVVITLLVLSSCSNNDDKKYVFGFSQGIWNHPYRTKMNEELEIAASLYSNLELDIKISDGDIHKQESDLEEFIKNDVDLIIVCPALSNTLEEVMSKAIKAKIPVIVIERKLNNSNANSFIGADNIEVGETAAKRILMSAKRPLNVVEIYMDEDSSPAFERSIGVRKVINTDKQVKITKRFKTTETDNFRKYISNDSIKVDYVVAFSDQLAYSFWKIAKEVNIQNDIKFIGVDGLNVTDGGIPLVINGVFDATVLYPTGGMEAVKYGMDLMNNISIPSTVKLNTTLIDISNAEILKNQFEKIGSLNQIIGSQKVVNDDYLKQNLLQKNLLTISLFLLILLIISMYFIYKLYKTKKLSNDILQDQNVEISKQRDQLEKNEKLIKEANEQKTNFFTGLSHEFKTPITLINSSVESLFERGINNSFKNELALIYSNTNRLHRLINQLLDFRKIEDRKFHLQASKGSIVEFTRGIISDFEREIKRKKINLSFTYEEDFEVYFDENLFDKIYFNVLSNALKFTNHNGSISIDIRKSVIINAIEITIKDNGIGIPKSEQKNIFKPFFKGSNNKKNSSGVGLFISKQFVELHKGEIIIDSGEDGTKVSIRLQLGNSHLKKNQLIERKEEIEKVMIDYDSNFENTPIDQMSTDKKDERNTILIIEDNIDLLNFLSTKFSSSYRTLLSTGNDSIDKAFEEIPDLIICDINLTDKNGFEITELLKSDMRTSHIPIIILTALDDNESYIKAMHSGADMYLTKPFSFSVLNQSIRAILFNRDKLKEFYANNMHKIEELSSLNGNDQQFIKRLNETINYFVNEKIENLNIDELSAELGISRMQIYRKVKALLGVNVGDYINDIILENAKLMLESTDLTVSEIAYANGYSSPNYFSTVFKNKYNKTPLNYRKTFSK